MADRGWSFVYRAGTLILAVSVIVWAASYYPHQSAEVDNRLAPRLAAVEQQQATLSPDSAQLADLAVERQWHHLGVEAGENAGGICHLRFDDTNPAREDVEYVDSIQTDVNWLIAGWATCKRREASL